MSFSWKKLWSGDDTVTETTTTYVPTTANSTNEEMAAYQATDSTTLPVLIIVVIVIVIVAIAVLVYVKFRNRRQADRSRSIQLKMSSTNNAGVYVDLSPPGGALDTSKPQVSDMEIQRLKNSQYA